MAEPPRPVHMARQVAFGFGSVSLVALLMCAMVLSVIFELSTMVRGMQRDEGSIRRGTELSVAVREQSLLLANGLVDPSDASVARYESAREKLRERLQALAAEVPAGERWRVEALGEQTQAMHDAFTARALPAARADDAAGARRSHAQIQVAAQQAGAHADALAVAMASHMAHAHVAATDAAKRGMFGGAAGMLLIVGLSVAFTRRLRREVTGPLSILSEAAGRFGRGEFDTRVGEVGKGELRTLGHAFDRMAAELSARQARLVQAERMAAIGELAAGVAHELGNPIGIIRGYLKTMSPAEDAQTLTEELGILDEEAAHCQRIAEDLLSYARTGELDVGEVDAPALLAEAARRAKNATGDKPLEIEVDAEDAALRADAARLGQVLLNLLVNASHASPDDAPVRVQGRRDDGDYVIEVIDRGPGVSEADKARIFEPFFTKRRGGTGLGLSVCLGIVRAHAGQIDVANADGGGAIFRVRLPISGPARESAAPREEDA